MPSKLLNPRFVYYTTCSRDDLIKIIEFLLVQADIEQAHRSTPLRTTLEERKRLVVAGKSLGLFLRLFISIVTFTTFTRWKSAAKKTKKKPQPNGRPPITSFIRDTILRLAQETGWGYTRIWGELKKLGISASRSTIKRTLMAEGVSPTPKRNGSWDQFLKSHAHSLWACDFFTKRVITKSGLVECYVLFFMHISTRRVFVGGITPHPDTAWMAQQARNFAMRCDELGHNDAILIRDGDRKFTAQFDHILESQNGIRVNVLPRHSPNLNAFAERWIWSIKHECLNHMLCFGVSHLQHIIERYVDYYHRFRPHQALDKIPEEWNDKPGIPKTDGKIVCQEWLGGLLKHYHREAA